jgi:hypothetical protein
MSGKLQLKYTTTWGVDGRNLPTFVNEYGIGSGDRLYLKQDIWTHRLKLMNISSEKSTDVPLRNSEKEPNVLFYVSTSPYFGNINFELDISTEDINAWIDGNNTTSIKSDGRVINC